MLPGSYVSRTESVFQGSQVPMYYVPRSLRSHIHRVVCHQDPRFLMFSIPRVPSSCVLCSEVSMVPHSQGPMSSGSLVPNVLHSQVPKFPDPRLSWSEVHNVLHSQGPRFLMSMFSGSCVPRLLGTKYLVLRS